jgi:nitroimidazol reductase NimA-like FMN-containing flavoprotein (pyridoxamine 5'-phosphate oxidase superfamily)
MNQHPCDRHREELNVTAERLDPPPIARPRQAIELTEDECWRLLASASIGRVVFTHHAMPAIRPVNHLIDGRKIIIRTHHGAAIASRATEQSSDTQGNPFGSVVCYEADELDPVRHTGWFVIATGLARLVPDPAETARYTAAVEPWIAGDTNQVVAIEPQFISGIRLVGQCS